MAKPKYVTIAGKQRQYKFPFGAQVKLEKTLGQALPIILANINRREFMAMTLFEMLAAVDHNLKIDEFYADLDEHFEAEGDFQDLEEIAVTELMEALGNRKMDIEKFIKLAKLQKQEARREADVIIKAGLARLEATPPPDGPGEKPSDSD